MDDGTHDRAGLAILPGMTRRTTPLDARLTALDAVLRAWAARRGGVVSAARAKSLGACDGDIRRLIQAGLWSRPRRGVYRDLRFRSSLQDAAHAAECAAALAAMGPGVVLSHHSPVRLLGAPRPPWLADTVACTRRPPAHGNDAAGTDVHVADFSDDEVTRVDGLPMLAGPRLAVDVCHEFSGPDALAVVDWMLRTTAVTRGDLEAAVVARDGVRGHRHAATVVERADPGGETWFESSSRWWFLEAGLPRPVLQHPLRDAAGDVRARVDMLLDELGVVGEADGRGKYDDGPQVLYDEKLREDWIRSTFGYEVVRWVPSEMRTALGRRQVMDRWWAAIARAGRHGGASA